MKSEDLTRLRKICGLLSSDADGERATAAKMATALLRENGKTWSDVSVGNGSAGLESMVASLLVDVSGLNRRISSMRTEERRLNGVIDKMREEMKVLRLALEVGGKKAPEAPRSKVTPKSDPPVPPRDDDDGLRMKIREALDSYDLGALQMSERTWEFLSSVIVKAPWTDRQREAVERTLGWLYPRRVA